MSSAVEDEVIQAALASAPWLHGSVGQQQQLAAAGREAAKTAVFQQALQLVPRVAAGGFSRVEMPPEEQAAAGGQVALRLPDGALPQPKTKEQEVRSNRQASRRAAALDDELGE